MLEINSNGFTRCETLFTPNNIAIIRSFINGRGAAAVCFIILSTSSNYRIPSEALIQARDRRKMVNAYMVEIKCKSY